MKGIILAGGRGTRLFPMTKTVSKPLLPVFDKPMLYYPLATLMAGGIRDIAIITGIGDHQIVKRSFGDGSSLGINIEYLIEDRPRGIAPALTIARDFLDGGPACLILSDNIFIGPEMGELVTRTKNNLSYGEAAIFSVPVDNPERFGVAQTDADGKVVSLIEKPQHPKSNQAVVGLYMYDGQAPDIAAKAPLSDRGEAEITWVNNYYREHHTLSLTKLGDDIAWHDAGTPDSMLAAGLAVKAAQLADGHYNPGCLEDIALANGWMSPADLAERLSAMPDTRYAQQVLHRQDQLADH